MDNLIKIFMESGFSELFFRAEDEWEPVLK